jgi:hypothetical protein
VIFWRGLRATAAHADDFGRYLALGVTVVIVVQGFINMSVVLGMMPTKGIPLPMISYGGSSLVSTLALLGIDECGARGMNVSEQLVRPRPLVRAGKLSRMPTRQAEHAPFPDGVFSWRRHGRARDSGAGGGARVAAAGTKCFLWEPSGAWKPSWFRRKGSS